MKWLFFMLLINSLPILLSATIISDLPNDLSRDYAMKFADGYEALTGSHAKVGELLEAKCTNNENSVALCNFEFNPGPNHIYINTFAVEVSLLDGILGEVVYSLKYKSRVKPISRL